MLQHVSFADQFWQTLNEYVPPQRNKDDQGSH